MNRKLLDKTLRVYIALALVVMLMCAPLFYFFSNQLFIRSADETLFTRKRDFAENILPTLKRASIAEWNKASQDVKIGDPVKSLKRDSVFFHVYYNKFEDENENHRVLLSPITIEGIPYVYFAKVSLIESEDLISNIVLLFCAILFLLFAGLYVITRRLSNRIWLPFYSTLNKIEQFDLDQNEKPDFESTKVEEFSRLNQSINRLIERNLMNYISQKEFVENAAHELQTPIAVFQAKLDILIQQVPMTDELGITFTDLNKTLAMLNRVNKNLLLLSKIETHRYDTSEQVLVSEIIERQVQFLKEQADDRKVAVFLACEERIILTANATLIEIVISNLLLNALRYNLSGGEIRVTLDGRSITVSNTSNQTGLQVERVFQRFSNPGSEGGNGLGLSIVKKVCDLHGWTVNYNYLEEKHVFQIVF